MAGAGSKPDGFEPRYCLAYVQANPLIKRKFVIGDPAVVPTLVAGATTISAPVYSTADDSTPPSVAWVITYYSGEKRTVISTIASPDTGLQEGDP